jgi:hypothetical protein
MLKELVIGQSESKDWFQYSASNASLVTLRHAVRKLSNNAAVRKWCQESGEQLFICRAEDTIKGRTLILRERYALAARAGQRKQIDLSKSIELAKRMKVMVTTNLETDLDIANGA